MEEAGEMSRVRRDSETSTDSWSLVDDAASRTAEDDVVTYEESDSDEDIDYSDESLSDIEKYSSDEEVEEEEEEENVVDEEARDDETEERVIEQNEESVDEQSEEEEEEDDDEMSVVDENDEVTSEGAAKYFVSPELFAKRLENFGEERESEEDASRSAFSHVNLHLPIVALVALVLWVLINDKPFRLNHQLVQEGKPSLQRWAPEPVGWRESLLCRVDKELCETLERRRVNSLDISELPTEQPVAQKHRLGIVRSMPNFYEQSYFRRIAKKAEISRKPTSTTHLCWFIGNTTIVEISPVVPIRTLIAEKPEEKAEVCAKQTLANVSLTTSVPVSMPKMSIKPTSVRFDNVVRLSKKYVKPVVYEVTPAPKFAQSTAIAPVPRKPFSARRFAKLRNPQHSPCLDKNESFAPCRSEKYQPSIVEKDPFGFEFEQRLKAYINLHYDAIMTVRKEVLANENRRQQYLNARRIKKAKEASEAMRMKKKDRSVDQCSRKAAKPSANSAGLPCLPYNQPLPCRPLDNVLPQKPRKLEKRGLKINRSHEKKLRKHISAPHWYEVRSRARASLRAN